MVRLGILLRDMSPRQMRRVQPQNCTKKVSFHTNERSVSGKLQGGTIAQMPSIPFTWRPLVTEVAPIAQIHNKLRNLSGFHHFEAFVCQYLHCHLYAKVDEFRKLAQASDWRNEQGRRSSAHIQYLHPVKSV